MDIQQPNGANNNGDGYRVTCWLIVATVLAFICEFLVLATSDDTPFHFIWGTFCVVLSIVGVAIVVAEYWRRGGHGIKRQGIFFFYTAAGDWHRPTLMETMKLVFSLLHTLTAFIDLLRMAHRLRMGDACFTHLPIAYASVMLITSTLEYLGYWLF